MLLSWAGVILCVMCVQCFVYTVWCVVWCVYVHMCVIRDVCEVPVCNTEHLVLTQNLPQPPSPSVPVRGPL